MVYKWLKYSLSALYPHHCPLCGARSQSAFCTGCEQDMPRLLSACPQCGLELPAEALYCGHCQTNPPQYQRLYSPYAYAHPVSNLITAVKYQQRLSLIPVLAHAMTRRVTRQPIGVDALLPVPLHSARLRERGFNQSLELARVLSKQIAVPILHGIERHRATATQTTLPADQREQNVRGAFRLHQPIAHRRIAIVDDVVTTGSTVNEIAKLLRSAGVEEIEVWCIARAI